MNNEEKTKIAIEYLTELRDSRQKVLPNEAPYYEAEKDMDIFNIAINALEKENKYDMAIKAIHDIKEKVWEIDIPSPTIPEYVEHHEQVKSVLIVIYNWLTKLEEAKDE